MARWHLMLRMFVNWAAGMSEGIVIKNVSILKIIYNACWLPDIHQSQLFINKTNSTVWRQRRVHLVNLDFGSWQSIKTTSNDWHIDPHIYIELRSISPHEIYPWIDNSKNAYGYRLASVYCHEDLLIEFREDWTQIHFSYYQCHGIWSAFCGRHIRSREATKSLIVMRV